jgi:hypothetical protein
LGKNLIIFDCMVKKVSKKCRFKELSLSRILLYVTTKVKIILLPWQQKLFLLSIRSQKKRNTAIYIIFLLKNQPQQFYFHNDLFTNANLPIYSNKNPSLSMITILFVFWLFFFMTAKHFSFRFLFPFFFVANLSCFSQNILWSHFLSYLQI